jgi:hypothetical protein
VEVADEVTWSTTAAGMTDIQRCPGNATGKFLRMNFHFSFSFFGAVWDLKFLSLS